ncbi:MAG: hypothetical protein JXA33_06940 [Anaerolineae bacterium]|nr:hypothetical protein [Anaerolineae bacterium]
MYNRRLYKEHKYLLRIGLISWLFLLCMFFPPQAEITGKYSSLSPLPDVENADGSLGTCYTFYEEELPPLAYAAGSRWDRFDFRWNVIEDTQGDFDFSPHDTVVNRDLAHNINVVGILGSTADWATSNCPVRKSEDNAIVKVPGHPPLPQAVKDDYWWRPCPPDNLYLPWNDPDNYWGAYVYQTVSYFGDRVMVWEIWNEPDLGTTFWTGSPADYAQLLKVGYQAAKAANPEATVLFAGLAYWANQDFYINVFESLTQLEGATENHYYFDVLSLHLYSNVYNMEVVANAIYENMTDKGVGYHPIWLTETGVPLWDEHPSGSASRYDWSADIEEAAAYVIEGYAEAHATNIEKFFFFRMHDDEMSESFGLIRNDYTLRPAYIAYQVTAHYLHGENQITRVDTASGARRITFWGTPHGRVDVLWNKLNDPITYTQPAILPAATLVTHQGQTRTLIAKNGVFTIPLESATAYLASDPDYYFIGGPPRLLIQEDTEPPISALRPLQQEDITLNGLHLTWNVTDSLAGYWYQQIAYAPTTAGLWTIIADYEQTTSVTQTIISLPQPSTAYPVWYLRSRARDRVGNWEAWPDGAEISTDFSINTTVVLSVTTMSDQEQSGLIPLSDVAITWRGNTGEVISQTVGAFWQITQTVRSGTHQLQLRHPQHIQMDIIFDVANIENTVQHFTFTPTMHFIRGRLYLPLVMHRANRG